MAAKTTKLARDSAQSQFPIGFLDESNANVGPFHSTHALVDPTGTIIAPAKDQSGTSGLTPVTGTFTATGSSGAFTPIASRSFNVSAWGTFVASFQLERSFDSGVTWLPLTVTASGTTTPVYNFSAAASEVAQEFENGVQYRLHCTAYTSGTVNYRISG